MNRYHKKVYFPDNADTILKAFNEPLSLRQWRYTKHSIDNIKYRDLDIKKVLSFIKELKLNYKDIFEYYESDNKIVKACYRIAYTQDIDIILVVGYDKEIITVYYNTRDDKHDTLTKSLYKQGE